MEADLSLDLQDILLLLQQLSEQRKIKLNNKNQYILL